MNLTVLASLIVTTVSVIGAVATAIYSFRSGKDKIVTSTVSLQEAAIGAQKTQIDSLVARVTVCEEQHRQRIKDNGKLEGIVETLERVLENRSPELENVLTKLVGMGEENQNMLGKVVEILQKLSPT